ncbi:Arp2/3 complex 16 kDa subunit ARPC5 [Metschnikowia bicuspidata var. bicuspidata NRRL YB-4993]|uniref:Actin-related protein 2/3 complex subunit 5 n=1 Tax=Metschnikowia bicuspidata var. bicuspidata NRRL YB-4993 TaxID=869754 RepID=A0A1A0H5P2_9ASCO|nr:Arp2/3 complex 16 kDa subunit ARPC5 [Metschnikowia bicuspidata var. bicuspidata NRRL YB-4993]OBA19233.1 Arp2/3 complex 16 kDa subunit ARPC5 [Metschnikowia bicuspidata var. bicuspidata NRRL YB-4993]
MEDWRRIDIDALEPENHLSKQDLVPDLPPVTPSEIAAIAQQVKQALSLGQFLQALQAVLETPPYVSDEKTKNVHTETVFEVLVSIKNNHNTHEFSSFVSQLSSDQQDTLVKYIYKIMSTSYGAKHGALLLSWFEKTVEVTGMGPVVRFYSDRRTV